MKYIFALFYVWVLCGCEIMMKPDVIEAQQNLIEEIIEEIILEVAENEPKENSII